MPDLPTRRQGITTRATKQKEQDDVIAKVNTGKPPQGEVTASMTGNVDKAMAREDQHLEGNSDSENTAGQQILPKERGPSKTKAGLKERGRGLRDAVSEKKEALKNKVLMDFMETIQTESSVHTSTENFGQSSHSSGKDKNKRTREKGGGGDG
ncbi:hypothetical protein BDN67DRAFT_985101 [Paxillus ammoniavirescens]|nr:hypothetical protein BDN67DRAFT_985101 [Paxillus ammoniavirescens]